MKNNINYDDLINEQDAIINILKFMEQDDMSNENLLNILPDLLTIACDLEFIDTQCSYLNRGGINQETGVLGEFQHIAEEKFGEDSAKIKINGSELWGFQYNFENKQYQRSELLANVMYLSNQIAHIIKEASEENKIKASDKEEITENCKQAGLNIDNFDDIKIRFYEIKSLCIKELVECENRGENVEICKYKDPKNQDVVYISLPGYFEPFVVHYFENDILSSIKEAKTNPYPGKTTFSFKVNPEQQQILEWLEKNYFGKYIEKIRWYMDKQKELENMKNNKANKGRNFMKDKPILSNEEFIAKAEQSIGISFSEELKNELLKRTNSANYSTVYHKIRKEVLENVESLEIEPDERETAILKSIFALKLRNGISKIGKGMLKKEELSNQITDAVLTHQEIFEYIEKNPNASIQEIRNIINGKTEKKKRIKKPEVKDSNKSTNLKGKGRGRKKKTELPKANNEVVETTEKENNLNNPEKNNEKVTLPNEVKYKIITDLLDELARVTATFDTAKIDVESAKARLDATRKVRDNIIKQLSDLGIKIPGEGEKTNE